MDILWGVIGVLIVLAAYLLTMVVYFSFRKRFATKKLAVEVSIVGFAYIFAVAVRMAIELVAYESNVIVGVLRSLYGGISGLAFDGLGESIGNIFIDVLYGASSLYAGLVFVSIFTAKASFEIFCRVSRSFYSLLLKNRAYARKTDVYVFSAVTPDALSLAHSISEKYAKEKKSKLRKERRRCIIIFAGYSIPRFDKDNPMNMEVMESGYLYVSMAKDANKGENASVLRRLGFLNLNNDIFIDENEVLSGRGRKEAIYSKIHFFALGLDERGVGNESANKEIIFDEMTSLTKEFYGAKGFKRISVDFYLLSDNDIDFFGYDRFENDNIRDAVTEVSHRRFENTWFKEEKKLSIYNAKMKGTRFNPALEKDEKWARKIKVKLFEKFNAISDVDKQISLADEMFNLHIVNEANLVGKHFAFVKDDAYVKMEERKEYSKTAFNNLKETGFDFAEWGLSGKLPAYDYYAEDSEDYRSLVLGFGQNGRETVLRSYINTSSLKAVKEPLVFDETKSAHENLKNRYLSVGYTADVFDKMMRERGGLFAIRYPFIDCALLGEKDLKDKDETRKNEYRKAFDSYLDKVYENHPVMRKNPRSKTCYPLFNLYNESCTGKGFHDFWEESVNGIPRPLNYKLIVIALGDDETNVDMANTLLRSIKHKIEDEVSKKMLEYQSFIDPIIARKKEEIVEIEARGDLRLANEKRNALQRWIQNCKVIKREEIIRDLAPCHTTMAVNLRDESNLSRLDWTDKDRKDYANMVVMGYGFANSYLYTYDTIVDPGPEIMYNYSYRLVYTDEFALQDAKKAVKAPFKAYCDSPLTTEGYAFLAKTAAGYLFGDSLDKKNSGEVAVRELKARQEWQNLSLYSMESNNAVTLFEKTSAEKRRVFGDGFGNTAESFDYLGRIEHERWNRFHIANGFIYNATKDRERKHHNCIVGYDELTTGSKEFDFVNVYRTFVDLVLKEE